VNVGLTRQEAEALATASGEAVLEQLAPILNRINTELNASNQQDQISIGAAQTFLAAIRGEQVPLDKWPVVFGRMILEFQQLGTQIRNTPVTDDDEITGLVERADEARKRGDFDETKRLLVEASELAAQDIERLANEALESTRQLASLTASRATLAMTQFERTQGARLFEEAAELRRGDESSEVIWWLFEAGDEWQTEGRTHEAQRIYELANTAALSLLAAAPSNTGFQRDVSVSYEKLGNIELRLGNTDAALGNYTKALEVALKLVELDPGNTQFQRDVSVL
ncbi:MAG: hypothetical protein AB8B63_24450, partial [Granulosicoccus sp.]